MLVSGGFGSVYLCKWKGTEGSVKRLHNKNITNTIIIQQ